MVYTGISTYPVQKQIAIPRRQFRSAYAERIAIPFEVKKKSKLNWWAIINSLLYPIGFVLLAADIFI